MKCWGRNADGQLGLGDTLNRGGFPGQMGDSLAAVSLGTSRFATFIAAGAQHNCALLDDATVKCWGDNSIGELGVGDTTNRGDGPGELGDFLQAVDLGTGRTAVSLDARVEHACAVLDDASLKCWGNNATGQLGLGAPGHRGDAPGEMGDSLAAVDLGAGRTAASVAVGAYSTCALLDNGSVKCWGANGHGQLGLGDTQNRGLFAAEMGDNLGAVELGTGRTAVALEAGFWHVCALLDNAMVKCWGANGSGQLGIGDSAIRGDAPGEMGDNLPIVNLGTGRSAMAIAAGVDHTCAILDDGTAKCWGINNHGQLGLGDTRSRGTAPSDMGDALPKLVLQ